MRLAIVGSREFDEWWHEAAARGVIGHVLDTYDVELVISGGADGVDTWARQEADRRDIPFEEHLPANQRWEPDGYRARNMIVVERCTHLLAIRSDSAKTYGSGWTADYAEKLGRTVRRVVL